MTTKQVLESHGYSFKNEADRFLVLEEYTLNGVYQAKWVDATEWSRKELLNWMGYA